MNKTLDRILLAAMRFLVVHEESRFWILVNQVRYEQSNNEIKSLTQEACAKLSCYFLTWV